MSSSLSDSESSSYESSSNSNDLFSNRRPVSRRLWPPTVVVNAFEREKDNGGVSEEDLLKISDWDSILRFRMGDWTEKCTIRLDNNGRRFYLPYEPPREPSIEEEDSSDYYVPNENFEVPHAPFLLEHIPGLDSGDSFAFKPDFSQVQYQVTFEEGRGETIVFDTCVLSGGCNGKYRFASMIYKSFGLSVYHGAAGNMWFADFSGWSSGGPNQVPSCYFDNDNTYSTLPPTGVWRFPLATDWRKAQAIKDEPATFTHSHFLGRESSSHLKLNTWAI